MWMEAEIWVMKLQTEELLEPPEAGRGKGGTSPRAIGESMVPTDTLISDF